MMLLILLFVVILNVLCIYLMYRFLKNTNKKEKFIFIAAGVAVMYILTLFAHWISTHGLEEIYTSGTAKDLVIFLFVPINGLIILPAFANSYYSYKQNKLNSNTLIKRISVLLIPLVIALVLECIFLKNVQVAVTDNIGENNVSSYEQMLDQNSVNNTLNNTVEENILSNEMVNEISNSIDDENISNTTDEANEIIDNEVSENRVNSNRNTTEEDNNIVDIEE